jgi:predicted membrane metal-binding protein
MAGINPSALWNPGFQLSFSAALGLVFYADPLQGYTVLRTDRNGWIELTTDGERMWVEVERH